MLRHLLFLALAGSGLLAAPAEAAESLRLEQAMARALEHHPALIAEAADLAAVQARADREALAPPYVLGADLENVAGTGSLGALDSAEATVRIGRTIELGGKRAARKALGEAEREQQLARSLVARLDVEHETKVRFIEAMADQQRLMQARQRLVQAEEIQREVASWVAAARNPETDLHAADIAVADARLSLEHAEHELLSARTTLAASWGAYTPDFESVAGDLTDLPAVASFEQLAARLPHTPDQRVAGREARTIAARRRLARSAAVPDLNVNLGVRRMEAVNEQALVMSFSMPLGSRSRSAYGITENDAQLVALEARSDARLVDRHQALFALYQELLHARTEVQALRADMLPSARAALQFATRGFTAGRFPFTAMAQARRTLQELDEREIAAATRYHMLRADIERLTSTAEEASP